MAQKVIKNNVRITSYMKNLARSTKYIGIDVFKSYAPVMTSFSKTVKDNVSDSYQSIKDFTASDNDDDFSFHVSKLLQILFKY